MIARKNFSTAEVITKFISAFAKGNYAEMEKILANDVISYITNAKAGVDIVKGREAYIQRVRAMNLPSAKLDITITQILEINPNKGLVMIEIKALRNEKMLHNYAAHLMDVKNGRITKMWMVEALPAGSDAFWTHNLIQKRQ